MRRRYKGVPRTIAAQYGYISKHFSEPISVSDMAKRAGFGKEYFIEAFRRSYGVSPKRYMTVCRLNRAKLLLSVSDFSAKQIADKCGFADEFYFYKLFRRRFGETPTAYRERMKEKHNV